MNGTGNALAVREDAALAIQAGQTAWTPMQDAALNQLGLKDAPDGDRMVFLHQCERTGLDPFAKQIYMIPRNEKKSIRRNGQWEDEWSVKWSIQTGIEGWRTIRDRAERREGVRGKLSRFTYYDPEGAAYQVWVKPHPPVACEVTYTVVDRNGTETPYTSVLRFAEYAQYKDSKLIAQWGQKPVHMLEKCTESDAYRKAFPQDYSGIEMADAAPRADIDWDNLSDAELDQLTAERAPGYRPRVTAGQARQRAPQHATAEVISVTPEPSPAAPPATPPAEAGAAGDAITEATWAEITGRLADLGVEEKNRVRIASQIARKSMKDCTEAEGRKVADTLESLDAAALDGLLAEIKIGADPRGDTDE